MFWRHALCLVTASNGEFVLSNFLLDPGRDSTELKLPGIRDLTLLLLTALGLDGTFCGQRA